MSILERYEKLLRKYFEEKVSTEEKELLLFMLDQEDLKDKVNSEQYKHWKEAERSKGNVRSQEILGKIKSDLKITDDRLAEDNLKLKGIQYESLKSRRNIFKVIVKYAAIILFTMTVTGTVYLMTGRIKTEEMARNEINVPYGSKIKITLSENSVVWLNSGAKFSYPASFSKNNREVFLEGEAFFDIHEDPQNPFQVKTSDITIKVLGTEFNVISYPDEDVIKTTLISGSLKIEPDRLDMINHDRAILKPNQCAYYSKKDHKLKIEKIQPSTTEIAWKDNQLIFKDETFGNLARKLERWYNVEITIVDPEIKYYKFSGTIENETIEQTLKALCSASAINYRIDKNNIKIFKTK